MKSKELRNLIRSDLYRYQGKSSILSFLKTYVKTPGFNFTYKMRKTKYYSEKKFRPFSFLFFYVLYRRAMVKYNIVIPYSTSIQEGLYIGHFGGIVVNSNAIIGRNCNLSHGVTIGKAGRGEKMGNPIIGDNVYIGASSCLIGKIRIGDNVAIGAMTLVNKDVAESSVVVGNPFRVISSDGSSDFINRKLGE